MSVMKDFECQCSRCLELIDDSMTQSIERLIFLLYLTLLFMIISNIVVIFSIVALCLGWA